MSLTSDKQLSLEALKQKNALDLSTARSVERQVTLNERNWQVLTSVTQRNAELMLQLMEEQKKLLTAEDMEHFLEIMKSNSQSQLNSLAESATRFSRQAGSASENISSAADRLTRNTEAELTRTVENTNATLKSLLETTRSLQQELMSSAKQQMLRLLLASAGSVTLLTLFYSLLLFLRA